MSVLIIADALPRPDHDSADFRFSEIIGMIAEKQGVYFLCLGEKRQTAAVGLHNVTRYRKGMRDRGVGIIDGGIGKALAGQQHAAVMFLLRG